MNADKNVVQRGRCRLTSVLLLVVLLLVHSNPCRAALKAKWTPNDDSEENPSLPLSMKQRKQLLQLQQVIDTSPNPKATLAQVAKSNNMSPNALTNMLEKNARDLQQGGTHDLQKNPRSIRKVLASMRVVFVTLVVTVFVGNALLVAGYFLQDQWY
jgi:hypothetical protein